MGMEQRKSAGVSFQHSTSSDSKLKGVFDLRDKRVKELKDMSIALAVKVDTTVNVADILTKCHSKGTIDKLMQCVADRAKVIATRV